LLAKEEKMGQVGEDEDERARSRQEIRRGKHMWGWW
jgi:hypothetical protein